MSKFKITGQAAKAWVALIFAGLMAVNEAAEAQAADGWDWGTDIFPVLSALLVAVAVYIVPNTKTDDVVVVPVDSETSKPVE